VWNGTLGSPKSLYHSESFNTVRQNKCHRFFKYGDSMVELLFNWENSKGKN